MANQVKRFFYQEVNDHIEQIKYLLLDSYRINFPNMEITVVDISVRCNNLLNFIRAEEAIFWGILNNQQLEGFVWGYERTILNERRLHVNEIVVSEICRNKGLGKLLLEHVILEAKNQNIKFIDLLCSSHNQNALSFYEKLGFVVERFQMLKKII